MSNTIKALDHGFVTDGSPKPSPSGGGVVKEWGAIKLLKATDAS